MQFAVRVAVAGTASFGSLLSSRGGFRGFAIVACSRSFGRRQIHLLRRVCIPFVRSEILAISIGRGCHLSICPEVVLASGRIIVQFLMLLFRYTKDARERAPRNEGAAGLWLWIVVFFVVVP